jgi:hypothetical protein
MLKFGPEYVDKGMEFYEKKIPRPVFAISQKKAAKQDFQLIPVEGVVA